LITADTLRRDHVSIYGGPGITPRIARLAEGAWVFEDAITPAPLTLPAHASLLTGLLPDRHGAVRNGRVVRPGVRTVAGRLGEVGYRTAAFVSSSVLHGSHGLARGFHVYRDELGRAAGARRLPLLSLLPDDPTSFIKEPGDRTVDRALRWLDGEDSPVFLWVHLYDAHTPHSERAPERAQTIDPCTYVRHPAAFRRGPRHGLEVPPRSGSCSPQLAERAAKLGASYAAEVRFLDAQVGRLLDGLDERGRGGAAVVFVADHGESLGEHLRLASHEYSLYEPVLRVPLVVRPPRGFEAEADLAGVTSTVRVAPTLLRFGAAPRPPDLPPDLLSPGSDVALSMGPSPQGRLSGNHRKGRPGLQVAVRRANTKVLRDGGWIERYDLTTDPGEHSPVWTAREADGAEAQAEHARRAPILLPGLPGPKLGGRAPPMQIQSVDGYEADEEASGVVLKAWRDGEVELPTERPSPEALEALRALGYLD
jgi:arylsulfatase A-like enzyme